ncbi:restriction endonuclease subunit S [Desulfocastanea catecholica]
MKWNNKSLGELFTLKHGYALKGEYFSDTGDYVVTTPGHFHEEGGFRDRQGKEKYYVGEVKKDFILDAGSLVMALTEQGEGLLGSTASIPVDNYYLHNQRIGLIKNINSSQVDKQFLYYLLNTNIVRNQVVANANGAKVRHTSPERVYKVKVKLPLSLDIQCKIANIISAYENLIDNNNQRVNLLEQMAEEIYKEWFVRLRFQRYEKSRISIDMPDGWKKKSFADVADYINGYAFKPEDWETEGYPIVKIAELKNGVSEKTPRNDGASIPKKLHINDGDILFSWSADLNTYLWAEGHALLNQHLFKVVPKKESFKHFLFLSLRSNMPSFRSLSNGATMQHIKRSELDRVFLCTPDEIIIEEFERIVGPFFDEILLLRKKNKILKQTRDLLLPRLISGKLSVEHLLDDQ